MKSELYSVQHTSRRPSAWLFIVLVLAAASVTAQTPTTILDLGPYTYDGSGNITSIGDDTYVYDAYGRLISGTAGPGKSQAYTYDQFGNLLTITTDNDTAATIKLGVSPTTNRISVSSAPYNAFGTYDNAGNMISTPRGDTFTYDALGMAKSSSDGVTTKLYIYTPNEERIAVIDTVAGTKTGTAWTIRDSGGAPLRRFKESPSGTTSWDEDYVYQGGKLLVAEVAGPEQQRHFFSDHLGTPRLITDANGYELSRHTYYPFGREVTPPQEGEALKFTGHERDRATLDYMHARYYENGWGRFLSVDLVLGDAQTPQSWNRYSYVLNNPLRYADPTGKYFIQSYTGDNGFLGKDRCIMCSEQKAATQRSSDTITVTAKDPGWLRGLLYRAALRARLRQMGTDFSEAEQAALLGNNHLATLLMQGARIRQIKMAIMPLGVGGGFGRTILMQDGYVFIEGGLRFSEYYYEKMVRRYGMPFTAAQEILDTATEFGPDPRGKAGFFRYANGANEIILNPATGEVWHMQPLK